MARDKAPTGQEIREKARAAKLDTSKAGKGEKQGKKATLTPAQLAHVRSVEDLENGEFVGVLDTEIEGDRAGLPPGRYNVFIARSAVTGMSMPNPTGRWWRRRRASSSARTPPKTCSPSSARGASAGGCG
jgi:hypothetical protein